MASSTDSPGPITKTVEDAAILLNTLAGHDPLDGTSLPAAVPDYTQFLGQSIKGLKIGLLYQEITGLEMVNEKIEAAARELEKMGAIVTRVAAMDPHLAISVYTVAQRAEVSSNLARFDGIRFGHDRSYFGDEAKRRIMLGTYTLAKGYADKYYLTAQKVRTLFIQDFEKLFSQFDLLMHATSPGFAKKIGATQGEAMFGELEDMLLEPSSVTGLPGVSLPCFRDERTNLFLGVNFLAPKLREDLLFTVADAYEKSTNWNSWRTA
jgi:aspartyl-tRNA(Asn)/glutamyl-tRNA(Gln) amidotransferase subunit A